MEKLKKPMLIVCGGFVILFIFMFIMASCSKKDYTSEEFVGFLVDKTKKYYENHKEALPQIDGGKTSLSVASIVEKQEDYIKDNTCSGSIDVINNNGNYLYIPNINCTDGYVTQKLADYLLKKDLVTSVNGLYQYNDYYIYRGDNVDNFVIFNNQLYRILRINSDGTLRIIETDSVVKSNSKILEFKTKRRSSAKWDDRYNPEKNHASGFNDFVHDNMNSRIKDTLESIYENDFKDDVKAYIVPQNLCIGKRSLTETINDGSIECANIIENQYVGLLALYEYFNASLDADCIGITSSACANYNYLTSMVSTFWTITAVSDNTYDVYKIGNRIIDATANSAATPKVVINISNEVRFSKGDGTQNNPYVID